MDVEDEISKLMHAHDLLQKDVDHLKEKIDIYEKRHGEDRENARQARLAIPSWAHLVLDVFLGYMAFRH